MAPIRRVMAVTSIVLLAWACYWKGWQYPTVFDDHTIFGEGRVFDYAINLEFYHTRSLPYFSIGFFHVLSGGDLVWNRTVNLVLHGLVALALIFFIRRSLANCIETERGKDCASLLVGLWFVLNPVAVYGSAYLVQRSIVMATLFGLVSATLYLRAQQENRSVDCVSAALFGALAMMSKEHAVLLPLAIVVLTPLVACWSRSVLLRALGFLALSLPCMAWSILHRATAVVGTSYEIYSGDALAQMHLPALGDMPQGLWLISGATQLVLFWEYLGLWLFPNPAWMSADLRVDFDALWSSGLGLWGTILSIALFVAALLCWWRRGGATLGGRISVALLYVAVLFVVELSVVRVQEPFVLYRSFLWMPGYALILAFLLVEADRRLSVRGKNWRNAFWLLAVLACLGLFPLARDRLLSFSSEEALWRDAEAKLSRPDVSGADRIYYNLAGEAFKRKDYTSALAYSDKAIGQNPGAFQGYLARGTTLLAMGDTESALAAFAAADQHNPPAQFRGYIEFKRCGVYSLRSEKDETIACLRRSAKLGYETASFHLRMAGLDE